MNQYYVHVKDPSYESLTSASYKKRGTPQKIAVFLYFRFINDYSLNAELARA